MIELKPAERKGGSESGRPDPMEGAMEGDREGAREAARERQPGRGSLGNVRRQGNKGGAR